MDGFAIGDGVIEVGGPEPVGGCLDAQIVRFDGFLPDSVTRVYTAVPKSLGPAARASAVCLKVQYASSRKSGIPLTYKTLSEGGGTAGPRCADGPSRVCAGGVFRQSAADLTNESDYVLLRPQLVYPPKLAFDETTMSYRMEKQAVGVEDLFAGPALALLRAIQPAIQQGNPRLVLRLDKDGKLDLPVNPTSMLRTPVPAKGEPDDYQDQISLIPTFSTHAPVEFFDTEACRLDHFGLLCSAELLREDVVSAIATSLDQLEVPGAFQNALLRGRVRPHALFDLLEDKARFLLGAAAAGGRESCWDPIVGWMQLYSKNLSEIAAETAHVVYIPADRDRLPIGIGEAQTHDEAIRLISSELMNVRLIRGSDSHAGNPDPDAMKCLVRLIVASFGANRLDRTSVVLDRPTVARRLIYDRKKAKRDFFALSKDKRNSLRVLVRTK